LFEEEEAQGKLKRDETLSEKLPLEDIIDVNELTGDEERMEKGSKKLISLLEGIIASDAGMSSQSVYIRIRRISDRFFLDLLMMFRLIWFEK